MDKIFYVNLAVCLSVIAFVATAALRNWKSNTTVKGVWRILYPASDWIYRWLFAKKEENRHIELTKLYPSGYAKELYKKKYLNKIACSLLIVLVTNGMTLTLGIMEACDTPIIDHYYIQRNTYGQGSKNVELEAEICGNKHQITAEIKEQRYTDKELEEIVMECNTYIEENVLGENTNKSGIENDLNFFDCIEKHSVNVVWRCNDYSIIGMNGAVKNTDLTKPCNVVVTAICTYFDYTWEHAVQMCVIPGKMDESQYIKKQIYDALLKQDETTKNNIYYELPKNILGENVVWDIQKKSSLWLVGVFGFLIVILLFMRENENIRHQLKTREQLLIMDYPVFVHKYVLLLGAGMSAQAAWMRMVSDYEIRRRQGGPMKYVYEEMIVTANEMKQGITQTVAFENFGHRCGLSGYLKFCSILIQNIKTGAKGMGRMLTDAADEAALMRRENAKRLGEEAGTKLLFPMIILLAIVMVILIVPAFMTMNI